jgi:DNA polymerase-3 subunit alpha
VGIGLSTPDELCAHARRSGYQSLALTDVNGTYGFLEFHLAAKKYGLKPIYGSVVYHTSLLDPGRERYRFTIVAGSTTGLKNVAALTTLSAAAFDAGGGLSVEQIAEHSLDVFLFVGTTASEPASHMLEGDTDGAFKTLVQLREIFADRVFVEIQDHGDNDEKVLAQKMLALADQSGLQPILTQQIRYTNPAMRDAYSLLHGIRYPHAEDDFFKIDDPHPDRSLHPASEMQHFHHTYPEAYNNTDSVVQRIPGDLFEQIDQPVGLLERWGDSRESLIDRCREGFYRKYRNLSNAEMVHYQSIIDREVSDITGAGLISTFLLHHHIISRLRQAGITLGPATGVNLQSLCAYLLDITSYDPYSYDERFRPLFDPRVETMAELELQLISEERERVAAILRNLVGSDCFAYVPAVERITPSRALRMVAKVVAIGESDLAKVLSVIARHPGVALRQLPEEDKELGRLHARSSTVRETLHRAAMIEGLPSGFMKSRRSAALSSTPLTHCFAHTVDGETNDVFLHASRDVLPMGPIFRIDFTMLNALTVTHKVDKMLETKGLSYGWDRFPTNARAVWREIQRGDPTGIFLFEGQTVQQLREDFELRSVEDLTNLLTLMRTRGGEKTLAERIRAFQRGEIISGSDPPETYRILKSTRGHIMYDEQLRDILSTLAEVSDIDALEMLNDAKAIDPATLSQVRGRLMRGMADHDVPLESAMTWFERVLYFAKHSLRRERVLADAILVYKMFYLKSYHPAEFYAALLSSHHAHERRRAKYLEQLRGTQLLLELDVNKSLYDFAPERGRVRVGFSSVPGVSVETLNQIVKLRGKRGFRSMNDFVRRTAGKGLPRKEIQKLVEAGAFDALSDSREDIGEAVKEAGRKATAAEKARKKGQMELPFD